MLGTSLLIALRGMAMGIAEVIPGVSGGTIAFITGIYERLLQAIKNILGKEVFLALRRGGLKEAWKTMDGALLMPLGIGMVAGLLVGIKGVSHLLESYPQLTWSFFFGLIMASIIMVFRMITKWDATTLFLLLAGAAIALFICITRPSQGIDANWYLFVCGMVAISALMLPGISGSFVLLLMGMYTYVLGAVRQLVEGDFSKISVVAIFSAGCLVGLAGFSRVITWMFSKSPNGTLATMTGFMIGSLYKVWPWHNVISYRTNSEGEQVPFLEKSVWPQDYVGEPYVLGVITCAVAGFALVMVLERIGKHNQN